MDLEHGLTRLALDDAPAVQALFERSADFFVLAEGCPPDETTAVRELQTVIPGRSAAETFCLGARQDGELVAFLHLTENHPRPGHWWLGLMLVDPAMRRRGYGSELHRAVCDWIAGRGATTLWLGVVEQNADALRFWQKLGYTEHERQPYPMAAGTQAVVILMSRRPAPLPTLSTLLPTPRRLPGPGDA